MIDSFIFPKELVTQVFELEKSRKDNSVSEARAFLKDVLYFGRTCKLLYQYINSANFCHGIIYSLGKELLFINSFPINNMGRWNNFIAHRYHILDRWLTNSPSVSKFLLKIPVKAICVSSPTPELDFSIANQYGIQFTRVHCSPSNLAEWGTVPAWIRLETQNPSERLEEKIVQLDEANVTTLKISGIKWTGMQAGLIIRSEKYSALMASNNLGYICFLYSNMGEYLRQFALKLFPNNYFTKFKIIGDNLFVVSSPFLSQNKLLIYNCNSGILKSETTISPNQSINYACFGSKFLICYIQLPKLYGKYKGAVYCHSLEGEDTILEFLFDESPENIFTENDDFIFVYFHESGFYEIKKISIENGSLKISTLASEINMFSPSMHPIPHAISYHLGNLVTAYWEKKEEEWEGEKVEWDQDVIACYNLETKKSQILDFSQKIEPTNKKIINLFSKGSKLYNVVKIASEDQIEYRVTIWDYGREPKGTAKIEDPLNS